MQAFLTRLLAWLRARWAEPESRAAAAGAVAALASYGAHKITAGTLGLAELGAVLTFALPGPLAGAAIAAIDQAGGVAIPVPAPQPPTPPAPGANPASPQA